MNLDGAGACWDVPTADALKRLAIEPLPLGLRAGPTSRSFLRDVYYDTAELALRRRGAICRVRHESDDKHELTVAVVTERDGQSVVTRADSDVPAGDAAAALSSTNDATRLLRSIVNPASLGPHLELEIERQIRIASAGRWRPARFELEYAIVTVRTAAIARSFHEVALRTLRRGRPSAEQLTRAISEFYGLRTVTHERRERGEQIRSALESEALARRVGGGRWIAVAAFDGEYIAALRDGTRWRLPLAEGSGEEACRQLMRRTLGSSVGELKLLSTTPGEGRVKSLEVWICTRVDRGKTRGRDPALTWVPIEDMLARIGTPQIQDAGTLAALVLLSRSELLPRLVALPSAGTLEARAQKRRTASTTATPRLVRQGAAGPLLDSEVSLLSFNERVLALAEDESLPLLERVRYLAIVASNLDEFFAVRVGGLKFAGQEVADESDGARPADPRLAQVAQQTRALLVRQSACADVCIRALATHGVRLRAAAQLTEAEREFLRGYFRSTIFPYLTPRAVTATPGHSLPIVADRGLCFAVMLREGNASGPQQLAELAVPATLPRFVPLATTTDLVPVEEVIRQALPLMYPGRRVEQAHLFRVTRYADLGVDEQRAGNLAQAVQERTQQRRHQPIVRIEVEAGMPNATRELLLRELQLEPGARPEGFGANDVFGIPGLMDLEGLRQLADLPLPGLTFAPARTRRAFAEDLSLWETLRDRDVLLHHPYDDFAASVVRFFEDAADDPDVAAIKVALYRAGARSPIVDALIRAAKAGKDVTVFVELKARFDEERNVHWMKALESAGAHVVHGLPGYKNHSKIALVVRSESNGPRRYAHIGTGNYNAATARVYTDLGVLTTREQICDDVTDLFNMLTGSSVPAAVRYRACLVAPNELLPALLARIEREAEHARAGRPARIRLKVNGLADSDVVQALYRASMDGVTVDLIVRGICTLAPGLPGISERIRVVSLLGRYLEHARIFAFDNAGEAEYFIGSADLRPRNLRRRVEVLVPISAADDRARLDAILETELRDATAWLLNGDGSYTRRRVTARDGTSAQARFAEEAAAAHHEVAV
ncbi:MAG: polyphosphate kinase 1 [Gemmatimonadaceae bacterium]